MSDNLRRLREQQRAKTAEHVKRHMDELLAQVDVVQVPDDACALCFGEGPGVQAMNDDGRQLTEAVRVVSDHMAGQIGDPRLAASWDAVLRFLHDTIEIPIGGRSLDAGETSEDDLALALRAEAAIRRLDGRLRESDAWRDAVAEWRDSVRKHGPGSAAAMGCLLALVCAVFPGAYIITDDPEALRAGGQSTYRIRGLGIGDLVDFLFDTKAQALVAALEAAL